MSPDSSFALLMDRLRTGDQEAARRIFRTYAHRLIGLARSRLTGQIQQKEGPEDVVQSALASFFRRHAEKPFDLATWDNLWALLTVITLRKCGRRVEHYRAACRNVGKEAPVRDSAGDDSTDSWQYIARDPSPAEVAMLNNTLSELLRDLSEREKQIVGLALENHTVPEISRIVGRSEYLVRQLLKQVRARWERLCDD